MDEMRRRRRELGQLLRAQRNRLLPFDVGLQTAGTRRTPGLRREEVAALAGIGVTWYSRLEMGLDVRPSQRTLRALATVLRLDETTLNYALALAYQESDAALPVAFRPLGSEVARLFDTSSGHGMILFDEIRTAFAWNSVAGALLGYAPSDGWRERNALWRAFRTTIYQHLFGDRYGALVRTFVSSFRRAMILAPSAVANDLYTELEEEPLFAEAWERYQTPELAGHNAPSFDLHHAVYGTFPVSVLKGHLDQVPFAMLLHIVPASPSAEAAFNNLSRSARSYVAHRE
jgi:transcriptional regulator with XRE-family HTH domain